MERQRNPISGIAGPEILAHRGRWTTQQDKNSLAALQSALASGFGIETDVRDCGSKVVISHDPPVGKAPQLSDFLEIYTESKATSTLALNIKSDGLGPELTKLLNGYAVANYFLFDMSLPEMLRFQTSGATFYTRLSDFEPVPLLYDSAAGVWLDAFREDWWTARTIGENLAQGKSVAVVSPELHGRSPEPAWRKLAALSQPDVARLLICTDRPAEASRYFHGY